MFGDWHQLWVIISTPDNIPIVAMLLFVPFFTWLAFHNALANDRLIAQLESDPQLARTHHRTTYPYNSRWERELHTNPFLMRKELLAAIIITIILMVWALTMNAPLEEPANASVTMNPAKAPWYFLGLQEMLEYFDPWIAGVIVPTLIIVGLMAIPFIDANPLGNGYYTYKQRRHAIWTFLIGFEAIWLVLVSIGTFIRGPGFMWYWPTQTWDPDRVEFNVNRNLDQIFGVNGHWLAHILPAAWKPEAVIIARGLFGIIPMVVYGIVAALFIHWICMRTDYSRKIYRKMSLVQTVTMYIFLITMLFLPVTIFLRLVFRIKYVWETPWFSI